MSLALYLARFPKQTEPINFNDQYSDSNDESARALLHKITLSRKRVNDILLQKSPVDGGEELVNEYLSLLPGFLHEPEQEQTSDAPISKIPLSRGCVYSWTDFAAKTPTDPKQSGIDFEINSTILNLGLYFLQLSRESLSASGDVDQNQKFAFQCAVKAANTFKSLTEKFISTKDLVLDLRTHVINSLYQLSSAEAQAVTILRNEEKQSPSLMASLCRDTSERFESARTYLTGSDEIDPKWIAYLDFKSKLYLAKAHYFHGLHLANPDDPKVGKAIKSYETSLEFLEQSRLSFTTYSELAPQTKGADGPKFYEDSKTKWADKLRVAKNDNEAIYFETVPEVVESLPDAKSTITYAEWAPPSLDKEAWTPAIYTAIVANGDAFVQQAKKDDPPTKSGCCKPKANGKEKEKEKEKGKGKEKEEEKKEEVPRELPPRPFTTDSRIVIVGAGPAGIHMAYQLADNGYHNITLIEKSGRIGGKTETIYRKNSQGILIPHEMGTAYMHHGYKNIFKLFDKFECGDYFKNDSRHLDKSWVFSPHLAKRKHNNPKKPKFIFDYLLSYAETQTLPRPLWFLPDIIQMTTIGGATLHYMDLHTRLFGTTKYSLPPEPTDEILEEMNMPFGKFLEKHKLKALIPIFHLVLEIQGYGLLDTIPAFYGLWWISMDFMKSVLLASNFVKVPKNGYSTLWNKIYDTYQWKLKTNTEVVKVNRNLDDKEAPIKLDLIVDGTEEELECDFLILACPLKEALPFLPDATPEELEIFNALQISTLTSTLYSSKVKDKKETPLQFWPERMAHNQFGRLKSERNSFLALHPELKRPKDVRESVAYQYYPTYEEGKEEEQLEQLLNDLTSEGYEDVNVIERRSFKYFPHFSQEGINKRYPWRLWNMQAQNRTWYIGSSACYESVEDVVAYNRKLYKHFFGKKPKK